VKLMASKWWSAVIGVTHSAMDWRKFAHPWQQALRRRLALLVAGMRGESDNCLTCTFCTRNKDTWLSNFYKPELSRWRRVQETLNVSERMALRKGEDDFIGREIRDAKLWDEQFKQERENLRQQSGASLYAMSLQRGILPRSRNDLDEEAANYGMPPRPKTPDEDYLSCFHQQWDESTDTAIQKDRQTFLAHKQCSFYYPSTKIHGETLEACEKNRKDAQERSRFLVTTILIVIGIVATIVLGVLAIPGPEKPATTQRQPSQL
jgi:hypothetical protein